MRIKDIASFETVNKEIVFLNCYQRVDSKPYLMVSQNLFLFGVFLARIQSECGKIRTR